MPLTTVDDLASTDVVSETVWNTQLAGSLNTLVDRPSARVYLAAAKSNFFGGSGSNRPASYDTVAWDTDNMVDLDTNDDRITITTAGLYLVHYLVEAHTFTGTIGDTSARLYKNGATQLYEDAYGFQTTAPNGLKSDHFSYVADLAANDYIQVVCKIVAIDGTMTPTTQTGAPYRFYFDATFIGQSA